VHIAFVVHRLIFRDLTLVSSPRFGINSEKIAGFQEHIYGRQSGAISHTLVDYLEQFVNTSRLPWA